MPAVVAEPTSWVCSSDAGDGVTAEQWDRWGARLKAWWWLLAIVLGAAVTWWTIPQRMAKAEQAIDDLKGWAREVQGYTRALQEQQRMVREPIREWSDAQQVWWCCDTERVICWQQQTWYRCG
jgi:hypothetical protein